jgi:hypothetical protein
MLSDVHAVLDSGLSLGVVAFTYNESHPTYDPPCVSKLIAARAGGGMSRLFRGILKGMAPSLERLYTPDAEAAIRGALRGWKPAMVIIDDSSVAGYMPLVREIVPQAKVILRSHNVMHDVRREQLAETHGILRLPLKFDCDKYGAFERQAVDNCDEHWSITQADADRMAALYQRPCGHLSVSLPLEQYTDLSLGSGERNRFIHVGTIDFRRRSALKSFLDVTWPRFLELDRDATLILAGKVYGRPIQATNVTYTGPVSSDVQCYGQGRFAVNFQNSTGGLKLKTLTSLAAGRTLISTSQGVEGMSIISGKHYCDMNTFLSKAGVSASLRDADAARTIAEEGRRYVVAHHSRPAIAAQFQGLLAHRSQQAYACAQ